MNKKLILFILIGFTALFGFSGCANYLQPMQTSPATLGIKSAINKELTSLPMPKEKLVAAVYKFRDQTGQYKASSTGASWSTAVTQGATSILIRALDESGWFIPIEREGMSNLLNERQIIRSSRANYNSQGDDQQLLPPLLFAGIILEGGIISYDTNILTGGAGVKYFGLGASGQYRQDRVTIYLRAVSTQSGRILKTVYTSKTILSQVVDVNIFRFVKFKRLLEAETGYSYNEPPEMCVTEAIEKAVQSLIIEGAIEGLWAFNNPDDVNSLAVKDYLNEKQQVNDIDYFGNETKNRRSRLSLGVAFGAQYYSGDLNNSLTRPAGELVIKFELNEDVSVMANVGRGELGAQRYFEKTMDYAEISFQYHMLPQYQLTPYLLFGTGLTVEDKNTFSFNGGFIPYIVSGIGLEYMIHDQFGLNINLANRYLLEDKVDDISQGKYNDFYWGTRAGINFYF